jgi:hypothetical protein
MLQILKNLDLFGKEPDLYYKGNQKKTSWVGRILTLLYIIIYFAFFLYKIIRMINKVDVTFYETYAFTGEIPSAILNKEIFAGGIGLINPMTGENYLNKSIYDVRAVFKRGKRVQGVWIWNDSSVPLVPCELNAFGSRYQDIFKHKKLDQLYCFSDVTGLVLEGYSNLNVYSYFEISFYRCVNDSIKQDCLPIEEIDKYLTAAQLSVSMQDIDLTPQDYSSPIKEQEKDIPGPLYRDLHQEIYGYMQVTLLETEENIFGFEALSNIKTEMYLKYDHAWVISSPNIYGNYKDPKGKYAPMTRLRIQLANKVLTLKRYYVQLIDILGDVGGLMEVVFSFFNILSSFIVGILYEESLVNNLFSFDLEKKIISLKASHQKKEINFINENEPLFQLTDEISNKAKRKSVVTNNFLSLRINQQNEESSLKFAQNKNNLPEKTQKNPRKNNNRKASHYMPSRINIYGKNRMKNSNLSNNEKLSDVIKFNKDKDEFDIKDINTAEKKAESIKELKNDDKNKNLTGIIDKIKLNKILVHLFFCCIRIPKNLNNILLDEGMKIITEQLEIFNLFIKLYKDEKLQRNIDQKLYNIEMSEDFKKKYNDLLYQIEEIEESSSY